MVLDAEENKVVIIRAQQRWQHLNKKEPNLFIREQKLEGDRLLGLRLDRFLPWSAHIIGDP